MTTALYPLGTSYWYFTLHGYRNRHGVPIPTTGYPQPVMVVGHDSTGRYVIVRFKNNYQTEDDFHLHVVDAERGLHESREKAITFVENEIWIEHKKMYDATVVLEDEWAELRRIK